MGDILQNMEVVYAKWQQKSAPAGTQSAQYERMMQQGRQTWNHSFGDYRKPVRSSRDRRTTPKLTDAKKDVFSHMAHFKSHPIMSANHVICRRPFMGRCCECLPVSKSNFYSDSIPEAGFRDLLTVDTQLRHNGILTRTFHHLAYVMKLDRNHVYPDVSNRVLHGIKVEDAIEKTVAQNFGPDFDPGGEAGDSAKTVDFDVQCSRCRRTVRKMLSGMKASISNWLIRAAGWFLLKLFGRLLQTIVVHEGQIEMVRKAYMKNKHVPLIFLPLHRSHMDYIMMTFVLYICNIQAPYVAAGDNLDIPVFRSLLKGLGGFFIRRKLDRQTGQKDLLYRAVLHSYMGELLRAGQNMEFFVEGGRSRSGKALYPKAGLLSVVMETFQEGAMPDAYIVPVSISYEKIVDGNFNKEQMGEAKTKETFWRTLCAIIRVLRSDFGNVRIDLGQPFSLQEYYETAQKYAGCVPQRRIVDDDDVGHSPDQPQWTERLSGSNSSLYGTDVAVEEQRQLVHSLAQHIVYNNVNATALMSTSMIAFILTTQCRQGVPMSALTQYMQWLVDEVRYRGRDVGFTGSIDDVLHHGLNFLGPTLIQRRVVAEDDNDNDNDNDDGDEVIVPVLDLPHVFELTYYANVVSMVFALEAVMATAIMGAVDVDLSVPSIHAVAVSKATILYKAEYLCKLLRYEYVFVPPCTDIKTALFETLQGFVNKQILSKQTGDEAGPAVTRSAFSYSFQSDSDEDDVEVDEIFMLDMSSRDVTVWYPFLLNVLGPIVEAYWVTSCCLPKLIDTDIEEAVFTTMVHTVAKERAQSGAATFVESMAYDSVKNALLSYEYLKVLEVYHINGLKMLTLCDSYTCREALNDLIASVEQFRI